MLILSMRGLISVSAFAVAYCVKVFALTELIIELGLTLGTAS